MLSTSFVWLIITGFALLPAQAQDSTDLSTLADTVSVTTSTTTTTTVTANKDEPLYRAAWNVSWYAPVAVNAPIRQVVYNAGTGERLPSHSWFDPASREPREWKPGHLISDKDRGSRLAGMEAVIGDSREGARLTVKSAEGLEASVVELLFPELYCRGAKHRKSLFESFPVAPDPTQVQLDNGCVRACYALAGDNPMDTYNMSRLRVATAPELHECRVPIAHSVRAPLLKAIAGDVPRVTIELPRSLWRFAGISKRADILNVLVNMRLSVCPLNDLTDPPHPSSIPIIPVGNDAAPTEAPTLVPPIPPSTSTTASTTELSSDAARSDVETTAAPAPRYPSRRLPWEVDPLSSEPFDFFPIDAFQGPFIMAAAATHYSSWASTSFNGASITGVFQEQAPVLGLRDNSNEVVADIGLTARRMFDADKVELALQSNCDILSISPEIIIKKAMSWIYPIDRQCATHSACAACQEAGCAWCWVHTDKSEFVDKEWVELAGITAHGRCGMPRDTCVYLGGKPMIDTCSLQDL
eukprot:Protomagalhaensia_sp_Gyna_25__4742@NODE_467_length_3354_cov_34_778281_g361_i0_p1_GENE_NODE_467_length_3354_cov_34_778281_g361_i0NODE_467_length_3354_cov_34_778281_g361_i0_p1_ORF_typecomplete_len526_score61_97_NODE_467_length_3354_cov_34_778281_g361_i015783155